MAEVDDIIELQFDDMASIPAANKRGGLLEAQQIVDDDDFEYEMPSNLQQRPANQ